MVAPFLPRRSQVVLKIEAVEGTAETLADADVIAPVLDVEWAPEFTFFERDVLQPSLSKLAQVSSEQLATISFSVEMKGAGGSAGLVPNIGNALRACGFSETITAATSVVYDPISEGFESATIEIREGSIGSEFKIKQIIGARGTVAIEATKGQIALFVFTFTGRYVEPTEGVALANPAPGLTPLPFLDTSFTFFGVSTLKVESVNLDIGNNVSIRNDANEPTGNFSAVITGRDPVGSVDPEQTDIATINFFNEMTTTQEGALSYQLGSATGEKVAISAPKVQMINVTESERDDFRTEDLDLQLNQDTAAGDDELKITFS